MRNAWKAVLATMVLAGGIISSASAASVDERWKALPQDKIRVEETTKDQCRNCGDAVTIKSATDGDVKLACGEIKYFDVSSQNGEWKWYCGGSGERARMAGASVVRASRVRETGEITWEKVTFLP